MKCFSRKKKLLLLNKSKNLIINKLSVENIIEKFFKIDQIAQMVLSENQIQEYYQADRVLFEAEMKPFNSFNVINVNKRFEVEDFGQSEFNKSIIVSNYNLTKKVPNIKAEKRQITI